MPRTKRQSYETQRMKRRIRLRELRANPEYLAKWRVSDAQRKRSRLAQMSAEERQTLRERETERRRRQRMQQAKTTQAAGNARATAKTKVLLESYSPPTLSRERTDEERAKDAQRKREQRAALNPWKRLEIRKKDAARKRAVRASNSLKRLQRQSIAAKIKLPTTTTRTSTRKRTTAAAVQSNDMDDSGESPSKLAPKSRAKASAKPNVITTADTTKTYSNRKVRFTRAAAAAAKKSD